jgi:hydroxymethylbilane synthase
MTIPTQTVLRLGTRGSLLARTQSGLVARMLEHRHPGLRVEEVVLVTSGDVIADRPLHEVGGKGLFTKELELALLRGEIDFAVHSFKDVPVTEPLVERGELIIASVPQREDPRDVLVSLGARKITDLKQGARIGTGSLRRKCQLLAQRPDVVIEPIRGNIDTRLRKLREGQFDAVVLALAGLKRAALFDDAIMSPLDESEIVPAPGQGALALQCRADDQRARESLASISDASSFACVRVERELVRHLQGDCLSPIGVHARLVNKVFQVTAAVGARGGELPVLRASAASTEPESAVRAAYNALLDQDVTRLLQNPSR